MRKQLLSAVSCLSAVLATAGIQVDRYGQITAEEWPGKVKTDMELRADAAREASELTVSAFDPAKFDRFGGRLDAGSFEATGRFCKKKIDGRWWLITPEGHRFFLIGCDAVDYNENGYSTPVYGPGGKTRPELADTLPDPGEYPGAYNGNRSKFNYLAANLQRKYGPDFRKKALETARRRLIAWGFNSSAKWGWGTEIGLPYFEDLNFRSVRRFGRCIDPYDPGFAERAEREIAVQVARRKHDPMLVAYATENENGWDFNNIQELTAAPADLAAKQELVDYLIGKYGEEQAARLFGLTGGRKEMLANRTAVTLPREDAAAVITAASRRYHETLSGIYRKLDPGHMWFAASHCRGQSMEWIYAGAPYVDAFMLNEYDLESPWIMGQIAGYEKLDVPFVVTEFSFTADGRGMPPRWENNNVGTERERGIAYRHYTERLAAHPLCIGFGYFLFYDQPVTMRSLPDGENHNFGLVSQQDRPYKEMLAEVCKSNSRLEAVHQGREKPFAIAAPRSMLGSKLREQVFSRFLSGSTSPAIILDLRASHYFNGEKIRAKVNEAAVADKPGNYYFGTIDLKAQKASGVEVRAFLWNRPGIPEMVLIEESADNRHFTPVAPAMRPGHTGSDYTEFFITPCNPLKKSTRYVRIGVRVSDPSKSWAVQFCGLKMTPEQP